LFAALFAFVSYPSTVCLAAEAPRMEKGYGKVYALKGGWDEWSKSGYPTEPK
jgi:hypothetical protein